MPLRQLFAAVLMAVAALVFLGLSAQDGRDGRDGRDERATEPNTEAAAPQAATAAAIPGLTLGPGVAPHAGIDAVYQRFSEGYRRLDPEILASIYTADALYLPPESKILRGNAAVRDSFAGFFDHVREQGQTAEITFEIVDRQVAPELVTDVGIYTLTRSGGEGEGSTGSGKFVVVARPGADGRWQFHVDAYNGLGGE